MDGCTGCRDTTEILLKTALNTIQSINQRALPLTQDGDRDLEASRVSGSYYS